MHFINLYIVSTVHLIPTNEDAYVLLLLLLLLLLLTNEVYSNTSRTCFVVMRRSWSKFTFVESEFQLQIRSNANPNAVL